MPKSESTLSYMVYHPPTEGLLSMVPESWVPYGELMRLHKPAGYFAFYFPHITGYLFAQAVTPYSKFLSVEQQVTTHVRLLVGTLLLRGASCTWNDVLDAEYDRQVERTRLRPIPRNALSKTAGVLFTMAQTVLGVVLTLMPLPAACQVPAILFFITQTVYPYFKRFTNYPSLWLGISFAWGVVVGAGAGGLDVTSLTIDYVSSLSDSTVVPDPTSQRVLVSVACLYTSCVLNSLIHDAIYGHQDLEDDLKVGVHSPARAWRGSTKQNCAVLMVLVAGLLIGPEMNMHLGLAYDAAAIGGTAWVLGSCLYRVELNDPDDCMHCFKTMIYGTGVALAMGLMLACLV